MQITVNIFNMENIIRGEVVLVIYSKQDWWNKVPKFLPKKKYDGEKFLFIDKNGNHCFCGADFTAAEKNNTYPINVIRLERVIDVKIE